MTPEMTPAQRHLRYLALSELADKIGDQAADALAYSDDLASALVEAACAIRTLAGDSWVRECPGCAGAGTVRRGIYTCAICSGSGTRAA